MSTAENSPFQIPESFAEQEDLGPQINNRFYNFLTQPDSNQELFLRFGDKNQGFRFERTDNTLGWQLIVDSQIKANIANLTQDPRSIPEIPPRRLSPTLSINAWTSPPSETEYQEESAVFDDLTTILSDERFTNFRLDFTTRGMLLDQGFTGIQAVLKRTEVGFRVSVFRLIWDGRTITEFDESLPVNL